MSCVYRKLNKGNWQAKIRGPKGKQISVTTKLANEKLARKVAELWEEKCLEAENEQLTRAKADEFIDSIIPRFKCAGTKRATERLMEYCVRISTGQGLAGRNFEQFCNEWLAAGSKKTASTTHAKYVSIIDRFLDSLPEERRTKPVSSISDQDVQRFCNAEIASGKTASTVNGERTVLSGIFRSAINKRIATFNPASAGKNGVIDLPREDTDERKPFDDASVKKLIEVADQEWRGLILLGYQAGLRLGDAQALRWENVDLNQKILSYTPIKTSRTKAQGKRTQTAPMHEDLFDYLVELKSSEDPKDPIFPKWHRRSINGQGGLSLTFLRLMEKAGIAQELGKEKDKESKGRTFKKLTFHSLRHGFVSRMSNNGTAKEVRMEITGHASESVHNLYTHSDGVAAREAISKLPSVL